VDIFEPVSNVTPDSEAGRPRVARAPSIDRREWHPEERNQFLGTQKKCALDGAPHRRRGRAGARHPVARREERLVAAGHPRAVRPEMSQRDKPDQRARVTPRQTGDSPRRGCSNAYPISVGVVLVLLCELLGETVDHALDHERFLAETRERSRSRYLVNTGVFRRRDANQR
jgi:hypothetical protein